jgi:hypothetical protein
MACCANILGIEMTLEKELATYEKMKADLLKTYEGKFALIHGEDFLGAYDTAENAYTEGVKRFGQESFLVKQIAKQDAVYRNQALSVGLLHARI